MPAHSAHTGMRLSITTYFTIVLGVGLVLFIILGLVVREKGQDLNAQILRMQQTAIDQELHTALKLVVDELGRTKTALLGWDEVKQQLANPGYYDYWRANRLQTSMILPKLVQHCEIYNSRRQRLQTTSTAVLPAVFSPELLGLKASKRHGRILLREGFAVQNDSLAEVLGYVVLQADLLPALQHTGALHSVVPEIISDSLREGQSIDIAVLPQFLQVTLSETPVAAGLSELIATALRDFLVIAALLAGLILYLVIHMYVRPLRSLSAYIDALRQGRINAAAPLRLAGIRVQEIDKTSQSLQAYHQQLADSNAEVQQSEARMRTILDNVPDGILAVDVNGAILSCNPAASKLLVMTQDELIGRNLTEIVIPFSGAEREVIAMRQDGSRFPAETTYSAKYDDSHARIVILRDITERKNAEEKLLQLANYDPLTGLPNRTLLRDRLMHAIHHARHHHRLVGLIFMDLDRFKNVNDTLGHQYGDALLQQVAERLSARLRESDTVARMGGDEFMIIVEDVQHPEQISETAARVLGAVAAPMQLDGRDVMVSASLGITIYPTDGSDPDRLIKNADTAMYRAKEMGRNNYQYFTEDMNVKAMERLELEQELRLALQHNEFLLYYQPRVDMQTSRITGVEALLRWQHPQHGLVLPGRFISILEETALIVPVGEWVLRTACWQLRQWLDKGGPRIKMAINISARQFQDKELVQKLKQALQETAVPAELIEIEITESLLMENLQTAVQVLQEFHRLGVLIAVDDFGTGYSSLNYLLQFPLDYIKIDQSFIAGVPGDANACAITKAVIALGTSMGLKLTAEGVETQAQADFVRAQGCDEGQGYLFARPMPARDVQLQFFKFAN
jgi:diguanylate cyclase (GGDEF)-like protein